jgi:hypothetical protein
MDPTPKRTRGDVVVGPTGGVEGGHRLDADEELPRRRSRPAVSESFVGVHARRSDLGGADGDGVDVAARPWAGQMALVGVRRR